MFDYSFKFSLSYFFEASKVTSQSTLLVHFHFLLVIWPVLSSCWAHRSAVASSSWSSPDASLSFVRSHSNQLLTVVVASDLAGFKNRRMLAIAYLPDIVAVEQVDLGRTGFELSIGIGQVKATSVASTVIRINCYCLALRMHFKDLSWCLSLLVQR